MSKETKICDKDNIKWVKTFAFILVSQGEDTRFYMSGKTDGTTKG